MVFYKIAQKIYDYFKSVGTFLEDSINYTDPNNDQIDLRECVFFTDGNYDASYDYGEGVQDNIIGSPRIYLGDKLVGDSYDTKMPIENVINRQSSVVTNSIGSIKAGSSLKNLLAETKGSVSSILDKMLFPNYAPVYHDPTHNMVLDITEGSVYYFVHQRIPNVRSLNIGPTATPAYCSIGGTSIVPAGAARYDVGLEIYDVDNNLIGEPLYTGESRFSDVGKTIVAISAACSKGTDILLDSHGNLVNKYALADNVLLSDINNLKDTFIEQSDNNTTEYVLSARTGCNKVSYELFVCYPIFTKTNNTPGVSAYASTNPSSVLFTFLPTNNEFCENCYNAYNGKGMVLKSGTIQCPIAPVNTSAALYTGEIISIPPGYEISDLRICNEDGVVPPFAINLANKLQLFNSTLNVSFKYGPNDNDVETIQYNRYVFNSNYCNGHPSHYKIKLNKITS